MRIIFMGTPEYAERILQTLCDQPDVEVVAVYTQPDKPVGRKKVLTPPPVKVTAQSKGIAVYQPPRLREASVVQTLLTIPCDFIVVAAYGQILPPAILEHAPCINLHASILPQYRGASPIQQSLLHGDTTTGVTAMRMDEGLDTGDVLQIEELSIAPEETAEGLYARLTDLAAEMTPKVLRTFTTLVPQKQMEAEATHCTKITKADGEVNFEEAEAAYNKYRAFTPWPGIYLASGLKLQEVSLVETQTPHQPGVILAVGEDAVTVGCGRGTLRIKTLQPPSKKAMRAADYLNGKRIGVDDHLA